MKSEQKEKLSILSCSIQVPERRKEQYRRALKNFYENVKKLLTFFHYCAIINKYSLRDGVMVAQEILDLLVWVRALVPEPFFYLKKILPTGFSLLLNL